MKKINAGVIGFGTVGAGTVEILLKNRDIISSRVGTEIIVKRIADLDIQSDRGISIDPGVLTTDASEVLNDPEIDVVIELMGGLTKAKDFILEALGNGKHVVTANKALLAEHGKEIFEAAEKNRVNLGFEASVGGGIPVLRSLREGLSGNHIETIMGILNGTSNYILTKMAVDGLPYDKVVGEAIKLGYAEDPPDLDVDGTDAAHKLAILISLSFGSVVSFDSIHREGIDKLTPEDIQFADEFGYTIKLLAIARDHGDMVEARVHPAMVPKDHIMANVNNVYNAVYIEGDYAGPTLHFGLGAGRNATGSAVVSDIITIARSVVRGAADMAPPLGHIKALRDEIVIKPIEELETAYYFRFSAVDKPGVLSKISGILGDNQISISSVIQKGREIEGSVSVVMLTHEARESNVKKALDLIEKLDVLKGETIMIRVAQG